MQVPADDAEKVGFFISREKDEIEGSYVECFDNRDPTMTDQQRPSFENAPKKKLKDEEEAVEKATKGLSGFPKRFRYERIENLEDRSAVESFGKIPEIPFCILNKETKFEVRISASSLRTAQMLQL